MLGEDGKDVGEVGEGDGSSHGGVMEGKCTCDLKRTVVRNVPHLAQQHPHLSLLPAQHTTPSQGNMQAHRHVLVLVLEPLCSLVCDGGIQ